MRSAAIPHGAVVVGVEDARTGGAARGWAKAAASSGRMAELRFVGFILRKPRAAVQREVAH